MARLQLAFNVSDLDEAIAFYSKFFDVEPVKVRRGYANFAVEDPPLKLVLFEGGEPGTINHLGVEVFTSDDVAAETSRLASLGLATEVEQQSTCCYAVQDKVWVEGPDAARWEVYTVLADASDSTSLRDEPGCCSSTAGEVSSSANPRSCC